MHLFQKSWLAAAMVAVAVVLSVGAANAQSGGSSGSISGTVLDPSGAVVPNASVEIHNPVSGFDRTTTTDSNGKFSFTNVPFNPYHMTVTAAGFAQYAQDVEIRSVVPANVKISLQVSGSSTTVTVESAGDLVENDPTFHSDIDKELFDKLPLESESSSLSCWLLSPRRESLPIPMASSTGWATTRKTRFPWMASPSPTSRARCFRIRSHSIRFNPWKSYPARRPRNTEARPAW